LVLEHEPHGAIFSSLLHRLLQEVREFSLNRSSAVTMTQVTET
jgi:hypothetical protein